MSNKIKYAFILAVSMMAFNSVADTAEDPVESELSVKEQQTLERIADENKIQALHELYSNYGGDGSIQFDHSYMIEEPLEIDDILDFNHPYLQIQLSQLTEQERDEIIESVKNKVQLNARYNSIMNMGMRYGHRSGVYYEANRYLKLFSKDLFSKMSQAFPFSNLMLADGKIIPALIEEVTYEEEKENNRTIRTIKKRFRIAEQAQVTLAAPNFLSFYMNLKVAKPKPPQVYLLPINEEELKYWKKGVANGWTEGVRHANRIARADTRLMVRAFIGYVRFHILSDRGVVTMPSFNNLNVGTTAVGDIVNIGESVFEISEMPQMNGESQEWIALPEADDILDFVSEERINEIMDDMFNSDAFQKGDINDF